jgi:hypothetical protein
MVTYKADKFADFYSTPLGQALWNFLNQDVIVARMEAASELGKPAVAGIEVPLLEKFGAAILDDRPKQALGHMVRQILEARGWVLDQGNVGIYSVPFIKGTRYKRPNRLVFHVFRSPSEPRQLCLTHTREGKLLPPAANGKWTYWTSFETPLQAAIGFNIMDFDALRHEVLDKGYKLHQLKRALRAA